MKRKVVFLLFLLGIVALIIGVVRFFGSRSGKQGVLKVQSSPTSSIFLENNHLGRTPYEQKVNVGQYTIKLAPDSTVSSLSTWQGTIKISPGLLTYLNVDLSDSEFSTALEILSLEKITSRDSEISVITNPDGAMVLLDNETKGNTPLVLPSVKPGDHILTLTSPGFLTRELKIKTTPGYKVLATVKMAISPIDTSETKEATPSVTPTKSTVKSTPTPSVKLTPTKAATSSSTLPDPPKPFVLVKDTPTGYLRVRAEANTSAKELARINPGEKYTYFDTALASGSSTLWYQIKYDGKNNGWVSGQYVEKVE